MADFGIWSEAAGGIIEAQMYSQEEAESALMRLVREDGEDPDDLLIVRTCEEHPDQSDGYCEICDEENTTTS